MVWFAVGIALLAVFCIAVVDSSGVDGAIFVCAIVAMAFATVFLTAAWAVLGPGSYLKRLFWSHLVAMIVGTGYLVGFLAISVGSNDLNTKFVFEPLKFILLGIPTVSLAAQLPFWFFRFFFGWQFTFGLLPPAESFSIRDIFVFTFLAALAFSGPQMVANTVQQSSWFDPTMSFEEVLQPDGTTSWEEVTITDQAKIDQRLREHKRDQRLRFMLAYAAAAAYGFAISLLSLPIFLFVFRSKNPEVGCGLTAGYAFGWLLLVVGGLVAFAPVGAPGEIFGYLGCFLLSYGAIVSIIFVCSRNTGFRLTSRRRFKRENEKRLPKSTA